MIRMLLAIFLILTPLGAIASGDYIWEEKFQKQLPKAEEGDAGAQYAVATMFARGRGTVRDQKKAIDWFKKAADQGHVKSAYKLGYAYLKGQGVGKDFEEAYRWLKFASDKDYERAHFYLAEMMEFGNGVDKDLDEALKMYEKAASGGFSPAKARVARVKESKQERRQVAKRQNRLREVRREAEAKSRLSEAKKTEKVRKVSMKSPPPTTRELILKGGWKKRQKPTEYLPSDVTKCKSTGRTIECESEPQKRNIGVADIKYTTKAVLFAIKPTGHFKVSYRNRVLDVVVTDPEFEESGAQVPVKKGWQDAEHSLKCEFLNNDELKCNKNKSRNITLRR